MKMSTCSWSTYAFELTAHWWSVAVEDEERAALAGELIQSLDRDVDSDAKARGRRRFRH